MPVYEYQCLSKKCAQIFEIYGHINDPPLKKCQICKKGKVIRLISLPARPVVQGDVRDDYQKIRREAKDIAGKIVKGDQEAIADIYGADVAAGNPLKQSKKMDSSDKLGKIKRIK